MVFTTPNASHNAQSGQSASQRADGFDHFQFAMMVGLDGLIHDLLHGIGTEVAGRNDHESHGIGDQVQQGMIMQDLGVLAKNGAGLRVFNVGFQRHRPFGLERFHDLGHHENRAQVVFFFVGRPFEHFAHALAQAFDDFHAVAHQGGGHTSTHNDEGLNGGRFDDGRHGATRHHVAAKDEHKQQNETNDRNHSKLLHGPKSLACF